MRPLYYCCCCVTNNIRQGVVRAGHFFRYVFQAITSKIFRVRQNFNHAATSSDPHIKTNKKGSNIKKTQIISSGFGEMPQENKPSLQDWEKIWDFTQYKCGISRAILFLSSIGKKLSLGIFERNRLPHSVSKSIGWLSQEKANQMTPETRFLGHNFSLS